MAEASEKTTTKTKRIADEKAGDLIESVEEGAIGSGKNAAPGAAKKAGSKPKKPVAEKTAETDSDEFEDSDDVEPEVIGAVDAADADKDHSDSDHEDLLEGIPEEELKAVSDVQLPKVTNSRVSKVKSRRRAADAGVTMLTGDPVRYAWFSSLSFPRLRPRELPFDPGASTRILLNLGAKIQG